jgi:ribosomal protein S18 acetylase RimI-like enzyme
LDEPLVRVVVGAGNSTAIRAYRRMGFVHGSTIEVHRGESSEVLEWRR